MFVPFWLFLLIISLQIAGKINRIIREMGLRELGQLEQDLVFGDAGAKDVINFLRTKQVMY
jgi:syntaxin-binding protein 1